MLASSRIIAFVATTDSRRAKEFYQGVLGLRLTWFKDPDGNVLSLTEFPQ